MVDIVDIRYVRLEDLVFRVVSNGFIKKIVLCFLCMKYLRLELVN